LRDGGAIAADAVVVAVGIRPNTELARAAGLKVNRGIAVDDHLETSLQGIHAVGECAEHRGLCYGLVEPAYEQAQVLARRLAGESATYRGSVPAANLKVAGVHVFSAGDFLAATAGAEEIVLSDPGFGVYKKLVIANGRLIGAVLFGDIADGPWYLESHPFGIIDRAVARRPSVRPNACNSRCGIESHSVIAMHEGVAGSPGLNPLRKARASAVCPRRVAVTSRRCSAPP
jgi:NAD(P)H-nitrite reductase large subunit